MSGCARGFRGVAAASDGLRYYDAITLCLPSTECAWRVPRVHVPLNTGAELLLSLRPWLCPDGMGPGNQY